MNAANELIRRATSRAGAWKTVVVGAAFGLGSTVALVAYFHDSWQGWVVFGLAAMSRWLNGRSFKRTIVAAYCLGRDGDV